MHVFFLNFFNSLYFLFFSAIKIKQKWQETNICIKRVMNYSWDKWIKNANLMKNVLQRYYGETIKACIISKWPLWPLSKPLLINKVVDPGILVELDFLLFNFGSDFLKGRILISWKSGIKSKTFLKSETIGSGLICIIRIWSISIPIQQLCQRIRMFEFLYVRIGSMIICTYDHGSGGGWYHLILPRKDILSWLTLFPELRIRILLLKGSDPIHEKFRSFFSKVIRKIVSGSKIQILK